MSIKEMGLVLFIIFAFVLLLPSFVALIRKTGTRWGILIVNLLLLLCAKISIFLAAAGWLILMLAAIAGKKAVDRLEIPDVKIKGTKDKR